MDTSTVFFQQANLIEAGFWIVVGLSFALAALRRSGPRRVRCLQATVAFIAFGGSDIVESHTGAWWRPWWLLAWKAACVICLAALLLDYCRARRRR